MSARQRAERVVTRLDWLAPLLARVTLGVLFISTGWGKVHNLAKVAAFFAELHIPAPALQATFVSYVELIGGALRAARSVRPLGVPASDCLHGRRDPDRQGRRSARPARFVRPGRMDLPRLFVWLALAGPGRASLDHLIFGRQIPRPARVERAVNLSTEAV